MFSDDSPLRRIDLRALPISVKITLGLLVAMVVGGIVTNLVMNQVVRDAESDVALNDLQAFSQTTASHVVDAIHQEMLDISRFGSSTLVQQRLLLDEGSSPTTPSGASSAIYQPDALLINDLISFIDLHREFDTVVILDKSGHVVGVLPTPKNVDAITQANWAWFNTAYNNGVGGTYLSGPIDDGLTGRRGVHIAVPIYAPNSTTEVIGVIYGVWNLTNTQSLTSPGGNRQGIILQPDGTVMMSPVTYSGDRIDPSLLKTLTDNMHSGGFVYTDSTGSRALYGHTQFTEISPGDDSIAGLNWIVIVREPVDVLDNSITLLLGRLRVLLVVVAVVAAMALLFLSRVLFFPLRSLTLAAVAIQQGNLDTSIPRFPPDEIGQLAGILDNVVGQLLRRVRQLRSAVQISRLTAVTHTRDEMLNDVAQALGQQFNYPDVRIYIVDSTGKRVRLEAAFGAESERLLKIGYRLALDEESLVGRAMLLNEPLLGGGKEALRQAGLITEHSELAVPLNAAGHMLGAIHILAGRLRELDKEDIEVMSLVGDQLSTALQNARLLEQGRGQIAEIEALNRRLTRQAWEEYVGASGALRHTLDPDQQWPETMSEVRRLTEIKAEIHTDSNGRSVLAAPLILRGEAMGTLAVTRPAGEKWSRDEVLLLESIASRMAMIAEGIRLVEESSRRAEREQRVNEISASMLQRATSVETVLRSALNELGGALGSDRIALRIGSVPARTDHQIGTGPFSGTDTQPETGSDGASGANGGGGVNDGAD